jgi:hypothetical protein
MRGGLAAAETSGRRHRYSILREVHRFSKWLRISGALFAAGLAMAPGFEAHATLLGDPVGVFVDSYNGDPGGPGQGDFSELGSGVVTQSGLTFNGVFTQITVLPTSIILGFAPPPGLFAVNETFSAATFFGFIVTVGPVGPIPLLFPNVVAVDGGSVENFSTQMQQTPDTSVGLPPFAPPAGVNDLFSGMLSIDFAGLTEGQTQYGDAPVVITLAGGSGGGTTAIPEPSSAALLSTVLVAYGLLVRRRKIGRHSG